MFCLAILLHWFGMMTRLVLWLNHFQCLATYDSTVDTMCSCVCTYIGMYVSTYVCRCIASQFPGTVCSCACVVPHLYQSLTEGAFLVKYFSWLGTPYLVTIYCTVNVLRNATIPRSCVHMYVNVHVCIGVLWC